MNYTTESFTFTVRMGWEATQLAKTFCQHQSKSQNAEQVYRNTLAVYAVNVYLQCLGIQTDLEGSDSWNPVMQSLADIASLEVKHLGKLECRPVLEGKTVVDIPCEVWQDRIGYVVVQLEESCRRATLMGFVEKVITETLPLSQLRSLADLPDYINQLKRSQTTNKLVKLSEWLHNIFDVGWETVETLLSPPHPELAVNFRSSPYPKVRSLETSAESVVKRGKLLDLGVQPGSEQVALFVGLKPTESPELDICVEVYPMGSQLYLPQDLQLMVLDEKGEAVMQAQARSTKSIKLEFSGEPGECFSVKVALGNLSLTEAFMA